MIQQKKTTKRQTAQVLLLYSSYKSYLYVPRLWRGGKREASKGSWDFDGCAGTQHETHDTIGTATSCFFWEGGAGPEAKGGCYSYDMGAAAVTLKAQ